MRTTTIDEVDGVHTGINLNVESTRQAEFSNGCVLEALRQSRFIFGVLTSVWYQALSSYGLRIASWHLPQSCAVEAVPLAAPLTHPTAGKLILA